MRIWFDTEFIEDGQTIELVSIGLVREDGAELYLESSAARLYRADDWFNANVLPHLTHDTMPRDRMAEVIVDFAGDAPQFWAYYADYDWVALCQLYGRMIDLPKGWPMYCRDLKQLADERGLRFPKQEGAEHNALADARWNRASHLWLEQQPREPNA